MPSPSPIVPTTANSPAPSNPPINGVSSSGSKPILGNGHNNLTGPPPAPPPTNLLHVTSSSGLQNGVASPIPRTVGLNNNLSTGGVTPGIKQATLISGVGVSGSGAQGVMTVNNSGTGQNQTVVLTKGTGVTMAASPGTIQATPGTPTNVSAPAQSIAIGAGTGIQLLNMNNLNAVRTTPLSPQVIAAAGPAGTKAIQGQRMIISQQMLNNARAGQPGPITLQALPGLPPGSQGILVKTESGQYQLLRVAPTAANVPTTSIAQQLPNNTTPTSLPPTTTSLSNHVVSTSPSLSSQLVGTVVVSSTNSTTPTISSPTSQPNIRLQSIASNAATNSASGVGMASMSQQMYAPQQAYSPTSIASNTANTVSQMTAETAKVKCKNFLSFLLELSAKQNQQVSRNVKALIQGLVDGKVNEMDFADRLQREVNSQPQPCLVGFLKKSLPHLRHSLATNELKIDGIKAPPLSSVPTPPPITALIPQNQQIRTVAPNMSAPVRIITPINPNSNAPPPYAAPVLPSSSNNSSPSYPRPTGPSSTLHKTPSSGKTSKGKSSSSGSSSTASSPGLTSSKITSKASAKDKEKKSFSGYSGDDDINDVAAMGGVNLAEESQKILGSTEFVGTQIRSVGRDETFLHSASLQARLKSIAAKYGLDEPPPEVAAMISHATEERLKTLVEKLAVIAEHRLDVIKMDDRYQVTQDVKGQLRFLEELEKLERKRHDEQEREMLIRAAKSRSKSEDPEQAKLKAKAKEMQRVQLEEMRQREANQTALQAIGPRKKPKLDTQSGSQSTISQSPLTGIGASGNSRTQISMRPRLKRVNIRDLLFLLEQEKDTTRSHFLYKNLLK